MTRTTYPATWPGTCVIRSVNTPFNWQTTDHARMSCVIASDTALRTPVYNQWLAARRASPDSTPDRRQQQYRAPRWNADILLGPRPCQRISANPPPIDLKRLAAHDLDD